MARRRILSLREEYFDWLYAQARGSIRPSYTKLCKEMHKTNFRWSVPNDDNRCQDGLNLRSEFVELLNLDETHLEVRYFLKGESCTFFEMLVALAKRMNIITFDLMEQDRTEHWFYELLVNTGLSRYPDESSKYPELTPVQEAEVCDTLCAILDRTYSKSGTGSLFPLKVAHKEDMREVEIWYQLMLWLDENYGM